MRTVAWGTPRRRRHPGYVPGVEREAWRMERRKESAGCTRMHTWVGLTAVPTGEMGSPGGVPPG